MTKEITPGQLLKQTRKQHKLTQIELAQHADCVRSMICMIEKDRRKPSFELAMRIAKSFPISDKRRELLVWYLTRTHHNLERLKHDYPNTFEDLRASWFGKNQNRVGYGG